MTQRFEDYGNLDPFRYALALAKESGAYVPDMDTAYPVPPVCTAYWTRRDWARYASATIALETH